MVGSGGPTCPRCPHGRALTSLRSQFLTGKLECPLFARNRGLEDKLPRVLYFGVNLAKEWRDIKWAQRGPTPFWCLCLECHAAVWGQRAAFPTDGHVPWPSLAHDSLWASSSFDGKVNAAVQSVLSVMADIFISHVAMWFSGTGAANRLCRVLCAAQRLAVLPRCRPPSAVALQDTGCAARS